MLFVEESHFKFYYFITGIYDVLLKKLEEEDLNEGAFILLLISLNRYLFLKTITQII